MFSNAVSCRCKFRVFSSGVATDVPADAIAIIEDDLVSVMEFGNDWVREYSIEKLRYQIRTNRDTKAYILLVDDRSDMDPYALLLVLVVN